MVFFESSLGASYVVENHCIRYYLYNNDNKNTESPTRPHKAQEFHRALQFAVCFSQKVTLIDFHNQPGRVLLLPILQKEHVPAQCYTAGKQWGGCRNWAFCFQNSCSHITEQHTEELHLRGSGHIITAPWQWSSTERTNEGES